MEVKGLAAGEYGQSADKPEKRFEEQYQTEHTKNLNIFSKGVSYDDDVVDTVQRFCVYVRMAAQYGPAPVSASHACVVVLM
ncbi:hypothetical protein DPX16_12962 [Anabarilius grahami]|uniref:Uncharacterized protein n=1 Tax=Anabarilius grahami TaxID=495550 RepID=A0A3N0XDK2_ANAGA|nr:hypothetical protein DPX16_12962 [Anabarilius grahami]